MNKKQVINQLQQQYPGKKIICLPENKPTEIICEIDPTSDHPDFSIAISVIDKSRTHYHQKTTEIYEVFKGNLTLTVNNKKHQLKPGDKITINPGQKHSSVGKQTWIKATSYPGWVPADHLIS